MMKPDFYYSVLNIKDDELAKKLGEASTEMRARKGEVVVQQGEKQSNVYFILDGVFRGYYVTDDGKDVTECIGFRKGELAIAMPGPNQIADVNIQALCDSTYVSVPAEKIVSLCSEYQVLASIYNEYLKQAIVRLNGIHTAMSTMEAKERYEWFLSSYDGVIDRISHKYIASFLKLAPETLSRVRKEVKI